MSEKKSFENPIFTCSIVESSLFIFLFDTKKSTPD